MNFLVLAILALLASVQHPSTPEGDAILGIWKAKEMKHATIEVYQEEDGFYYGKIIACDREDWVGAVILKKAKY